MTTGVAPSERRPKTAGSRGASGRLGVIDSPRATAAHRRRIVRTATVARHGYPLAGSPRPKLGPDRAGEQLPHRLHDRRRLAEPARADVAAGEPARLGANEPVAEGVEVRDVPLGDRVLPHAVVHGRGEGHGAGGGGGEEAHDVVAQAVGDLGDRVGGGGGDQEQVGPLGQADVLGVGGVGQGPDVGVDGAAGQGLEREGADEPDGIRRHGDRHAGPGLDELGKRRRRPCTRRCRRRRRRQSLGRPTGSCLRLTRTHEGTRGKQIVCSCRRAFVLDGRQCPFVGE